MNLPPSDTRERPLGSGAAHDDFGAGPVPGPSGIDQGPSVAPSATSRARRRPDYRLRGLDLGVQSLDEARTLPTRKVGSHRRRRLRFLIRSVVVLAMATVVALLLREFVVQPFTVPSAAMAPTLQVGDQILVVKSRLLAGPIMRGDIVVFSHPKAFSCRAAGSAAQDLVKRVVGLPGETIWSNSKTIYVDRHLLDERGWYDPTFGPVGSTPILRTTIPADDYFVMGDNRTDSCDSRSFGAISGSSIVGQVVAIVLRDGHPHIHLLSSVTP
jgi:signal peptidase I